MKYEMRRMDRAITESDARSILEKGIYGILSTVGEDGYPYGVPINYVCKDDAIYFNCARDCGRKISNLRYSSKAGFTVVGDSEVLKDKFAMNYESVIVNGTISEVIEEKETIFEKLLVKYSSDYMESGKKYMLAAGEKAAIYKLTIEEISGKARR